MNLLGRGARPFSGSVRSRARIDCAPEQVWAAIVDPVLLVRFTPLLQHIDVAGTVWRWHLISVGALGISVAPVFTEQMTFDPPHRIDFVHAPPTDAVEHAAAHGSYRLAAIPGGTQLDIDLAVQIELPVPAAAGAGVRKLMEATMTRTGERFAANLLSHLNAHELP